MRTIAAMLLIAILSIFISLSFLNSYEISDLGIERIAKKVKPEQKDWVVIAFTPLKGQHLGKGEFLSQINIAWAEVSHKIESYNVANPDKKTEAISDFKDYNFELFRTAGVGFASKNKVFLFWSLFLGTILGACMYILPMFKEGEAGIKHNGIFFSPWLNRGLPGIMLGTILIVFYIVLYFFPYLIAEQISLFDVPRSLISGFEADRWFMYGCLYCIAVGTMGIRMFAKYRHNRYEQLRTLSVMFFQLVFAFMIPEILAFLNQPYMQFHQAWPLDYSLFFDYRLYSFIGKAEWGYTGGTMTFFGIKTGLLFLIWGIVFSLIIVPLMTYKYGKRWYCSFVCGCGGLAETLGDPFRQQSDKSLKAWKIERYLIYSVLVFAVIMTIMVLITFFTNGGFGFSYTIRSWYGFLISSIFAGVVGTGFYPLMGSRMWCRFGCPLAAVMGIIQKYKSRFRITTNGGQCISCGNCSTYCEMGIDVRAYAQRGENIVRASCVGCGVCAAVCPRGVLRLENGDFNYDKERGTLY